MARQTRPIGIPTFEDKVLQRAVSMVLEAVYEQSFLNGSYGFRPGRSAHQALQDVRDQAMRMAGRWVLEVDVRKFFETLDHGHLRSIVRKRVRDGMLLRLIDKWLKAGVMEDGMIEYPRAGTPRVVAFRLSSPTSTCTKCWMSGSCGKLLRGSSAVRT